MWQWDSWVSSDVRDDDDVHVSEVQSSLLAVRADQPDDGNGGCWSLHQEQIQQLPRRQLTCIVEQSLYWTLPRSPATKLLADPSSMSVAKSCSGVGRRHGSPRGSLF